MSSYVFMPEYLIAKGNFVEICFQRTAGLVNLVLMRKEYLNQNSQAIKKRVRPPKRPG